MDILSKYTIAHKGLSIGSHDFEFKVDSHFFQAFQGSEIQKGHCVVKVDLEKQSSLMTLDFNITGGITVECDRCLEEFEIEIEEETTLYIRYSETENEYDDEIMWVSPNETEISLAQYIYETICLALPYQRVHPEDKNGESTCDPKMLAKFKVVTQDEFEQIVSKKEGSTSPWSKLEELKTKLENQE